MIYIAGNESFGQGPIAYKDQCASAKKKDVCINTIFCGNYNEGINLQWKNAADLGGCDYFNIDSDRAITHIDTPYDSLINNYNDSINQTYYGIGSYGLEKKAMQAEEDANAEMQAGAVATERAIAKSKSAVYKNSSWDLIDAVDNGRDLSEINDEELPEEFRGKTLEEKKVLLDEKKEDRKRYQVEISRLAKERQEYIDEEMNKRADTEVDDFGTSVNESIAKKALDKGYEKSQNP
jgi:hypothetical protein